MIAIEEDEDDDEAGETGVVLVTMATTTSSSKCKVAPERWQSSCGKKKDWGGVPQVALELTNQMQMSFCNHW